VLTYTLKDFIDRSEAGATVDGGEDGEGLEAKGVEVDRRIVGSSAADEKIFVGCSVVELKIGWRF
jgi:hypothetical protein